MADAESLSGCKRKQKLLKHLKNVSTFNYIIQFCKLLISSQKLLDQSKNIFSEDSDLMLELTQKCDAIFEQIKEVVAAVSAEVLIQKLSEALYKELKPMEERKLRSFLLEANNIESSINSVEYLEKLFYFIDRLVKPYYNEENCLSISNHLLKGPLKNLLKLSGLVYCSAFKSVEPILDVILQINLDNVEVSSEEKNEWRCLLLEAANTIEHSIEYSEGDFKTLFEILETRSSIQYVLDLFAECPKEYEIFSEKMDKINNCKDIYDELIERKYERIMLRDVSNDNYFSDDDYDIWCLERICETDDDENNDDRNYLSRMISELPLSHTWWKKFKRNDA